MRIVYVVLRFPSLTETFVADEIWALREQGVQVRILSLLKPHPHAVQPRSRELLCHVRYGPGVFSVRALQLFWRSLRGRPRAVLGLLWRLCQAPLGAGGLGAWVRRLPIFFTAVCLAEASRADGPDGVHAHFAWLSGAAAWIIAELLKVPYCVTVHAYDLFRSNELAPLVCTGACRVVAISEYNRRWVKKYSPGARVVVIHCGVDVSELVPMEPATEPPGRCFTITAPGSLVAKKGHAELIEACALLRDQGREFQCTIIGGGPMRARLRERIESLRLGAYVTLAGARDHEFVLQRLARSDLAVLACVIAADGDRDGIPVALMEAAALGRALVSTRVSGIPELVRDGVNGRTVVPRNPQALAGAIGALMDDRERCRSMGRQGRRIVEREFSLRHSSQRMRSVFEECFGVGREH